MRLIDADELMKKLGFIRELERQIYGQESFGFALKCIREVQDALTIAEHSVCEERYLDLLEYFGGKDDILKDGEEFKAWLERMRWHVLECDKLARELEKKQERKKGKWVGADSQCGIGCTFCGTPVDDFCSSIDYIDLRYEPNFCPNCGADMRGELK